LKVYLLFENGLDVEPHNALAAIIIFLITLFLFGKIPDPKREDTETLGSAKFADNSQKKILKNNHGLIVGRDKNILRYAGDSHLITIAPTRTGKGVGTIIPNLLTADRSIICIDPKG